MEYDFLSNKKEWKKFELNNKSIALNILYVPRNTEQIRHICKLNMQFVIYAKKKDLVLKMTTKKPHKVRDHCHYT